MIQRIQTLYLIGVVIFMTLMIFLPIASFYDDSKAFYQLFGNGLLKHEANTYLLIERNNLLMISTYLIFLLTIVSIAFFKNRSLQIKLCWLLLAGLIVLFGLNFYYYKQYIIHYSFVRYNMSLIASMPLIGIVLTYLAIIRIKKDDDLVKSIDRLR
jgi:hypothetical protein